MATGASNLGAGQPVKERREWIAYINKCAGLERTPIVALGEVSSAVRSTVVDCPHGFMEGD